MLALGRKGIAELMKKALITSITITRQECRLPCRLCSAARNIVADTKFEVGTADNELLLIDECLTPDSSRFWPKDQYAVGQSPPSFDKQFVRDYLETLDWDKTPPPPRLPKDVIEKTSAKYLEAFRRLTGNEIAKA